MTVDDRISRLEKQNRRLRFLIPSLLVILAATVLMGAGARDDVPKVIRARRFEVLNANDKICGVFHADDRGTMLLLTDGNDQGRGASIAVGDKYTGFILARTDTSKTVGCVVTNEGGASVDILDGKRTVWRSPE